MSIIIKTRKTEHIKTRKTEQQKLLRFENRILVIIMEHITVKCVSLVKNYPIVVN